MSAVASARDIAVSASRLVLVESVDLPLQLIDLRLERVERLLGAAFGPCGGLTLRRPGGAGLAFAAPCVGSPEGREHASRVLEPHPVLLADLFQVAEGEHAAEGPLHRLAHEIGQE